jgi:hypothetical protein
MTPIPADGGHVVPEWFVTATTANWARVNVYRPVPTWEERLATAIEMRSLGFRWRILRRTVQGRVSLAVDALLGRHECPDDR